MPVLQDNPDLSMTQTFWLLPIYQIQFKCVKFSLTSLNWALPNFE